MRRSSSSHSWSPSEISSGTPPKILCWPRAFDRPPACKVSAMIPIAPALVVPSESKAPAFIRLSITFLFTFLESTLCRKFAIEVKSPSLSLDSMMDSMAAAPAPFTASRPNRIELPITLNSCPDWLISGGSIDMPISRHSLIDLTILSVLSMSALRFAAMNSTG